MIYFVWSYDYCLFKADQVYFCFIGYFNNLYCLISSLYFLQLLLYLFNYLKSWLQLLNFLNPNLIDPIVQFIFIFYITSFF